MASQKALTKIERIVAARYGLLVLPTPLNAMSVGDYMEYIPKFTGAEGVSAEEHLESFYCYADNLDINEEDVWMRVFVQSLDGEARKWFRELPPRSIADIEALDDVFLKHWGNNKYLLYYHTEFGNLLLPCLLMLMPSVDHYRSTAHSSTPPFLCKKGSTCRHARAILQSSTA